MVPAGITALRVDVSTQIDYATIKDFEVKSYDLDATGYTVLKNSGVTDVSYSDSTVIQRFLSQHRQLPYQKQ